jgi:hypothetical protein
VTAKSEYEAAYFTLLRAREEHDDLLRYREFLETEERRLDTFTRETREREDALPRRLQRPVALTTKGVVEAVGRRRRSVGDERRRIDDRIGAAQSFVEECEAEVSALRP